MSHTVDLMLSDHCNILFELDMQKPPRMRKTLTFRKTRSIITDRFKDDVKDRLAHIDTKTDNLDDLINCYNSKLTDVLDEHAPLQTKEITIREHTPWTTEEIRPEKQKLRKLEKKMRKTQLEIDKQLFKDQQKVYKELLNGKRNNHFSKLIQENSHDPKNLFKVINTALHKKEETPFPPGQTDKDLADEFNEYFEGKIENIRHELDGTEESNSLPREDRKYSQVITEFRILSEDEVRKLVTSSANKHCELDPIPTWLLKECIDDVLPIITQIINLSLQFGNMPKSFKQAIIKPLLKKLGLELIKKNYRPVSNLSFISKLIEKAVAGQLIEHLKQNGLYDKFQSAYRQFYSTETALLKVKNDVLMELDNRNVMLLLLLDLSAAFDTIDHRILLNRLSERCGIKGTCLKWFSSYLTDRTQIVKINNSTSDIKKVKYGVPQGSVLGPILFTIYMTPLGEIISECGMKRQMYADDTGLYHSISPIDVVNQDITLNKIKNCIAEVKDFLMSNKLKVNDDKTIFMLLGAQYWLNKLNLNNIQIGETIVEPVDHTKNLGVIFDKEMTMQAHVNYICKRGYYHVKDLFSLRKFLDENDTNTAAHAFVTSIMDYGNSLLYGISDYLIDKLQVLQNSAVRAVKKKRKFDHISEARMSINWLPVEARIKFKYLLLTWKCLNNRAPSYLQDLLVTKSGYRSQYKNVFMVPKSNHVTHGDIAFAKAAPILWNSLPLRIRNIGSMEQFKKHLKTHLFKTYNDKTRL